MCAAGDIVSGGQAGSVFVLVTAVERFGTNQTLLLLVKVTLCIYILLQLHVTMCSILVTTLGSRRVC